MKTKKFTTKNIEHFIDSNGIGEPFNETLHAFLIGQSGQIFVMDDKLVIKLDTVEQ